MTKRYCGAKTRKGVPCRQPALANGRCHYHGGKSLAGIASPAFKHGRYSKYLPSRLLERYQEASGDPELLALRDELSLTDARLTDILARVDTGEAGAVWQAARRALSDFRKASAAGDTKKMADHLREMESLIDQGFSDYAAWDEIGRLIEQRRRLGDSEQKRLVAMQQMITAEQAMILLAAVVDVVRQNVSDRGVLAAISAGIGRLMAANAGREDRG